MPKSGAGERSPWRYFENGGGQYANGQWNVSTPGGSWNANVVKGALSTWYPASGWRHFIGGNPGNVQVEFTIWSSSDGSFMRGKADQTNANFFSGRAHGFPVRCVRE